jgi:gliding motility-associated lipoprotein GldD
MRHKRFKSHLVSAILLLIMFNACNDNDYSPRPTGYFRIDMPQHEYKAADIDCPYSFEYSTHAILFQKNKRKCWYNIYYPRYKATIYLTYISLNNDLKAHLDQTQKLTYEHQIKASRIDRIPISVPDKNVFGLEYRLSGEVASAIQFYITDSTDHYLRGSLYFDTFVNSDSLKPVIDYLDVEIQHLTNSFLWK